MREIAFDQDLAPRTPTAALSSAARGGGLAGVLDAPFAVLFQKPGSGEGHCGPGRYGTCFASMAAAALAAGVSDVQRGVAVGGGGGA